jgi:hypothetical protein
MQHAAKLKSTILEVAFIVSDTLAFLYITPKMV